MVDVVVWLLLPGPCVSFPISASATPETPNPMAIAVASKVFFITHSIKVRGAVGSAADGASAPCLWEKTSPTPGCRVSIFSATCPRDCTPHRRRIENTVKSRAGARSAWPIKWNRAKAYSFWSSCSHDLVAVLKQQYCGCGASAVLPSGQDQDLAGGLRSRVCSSAPPLKVFQRRYIGASRLTLREPALIRSVHPVTHVATELTCDRNEVQRVRQACAALSCECPLSARRTQRQRFGFRTAP